MADAVLAIDPGQTTGFAALYEGDEFLSGEFKDRFEFEQAVAGLLDSGYEWEVVIERYIVTPETLKKTRQYDALYIIGAIEYLCKSRGVKFEMQTPADAKAFATDHKLNRIGFYRRGLGHANDAARHLLLYCVKTSRISPEKFL